MDDDVVAALGLLEHDASILIGDHDLAAAGINSHVLALMAA